MPAPLHHAHHDGITSYYLALCDPPTGGPTYCRPLSGCRLDQSRRPPHHRAVRDGDDDALPNATTGCEAQAMEEHAAEDIKHIPPTTVRPPAARSLPLGLADGGHAVLRGR